MSAVDLFGIAERLDKRESAVLARLRGVLDAVAKPLLATHWERGTFPTEVIDPLVDLRLMDPRELEGDEPSPLYGGFRNFELARTDASLATFYNAQSGLFRTIVTRGGSPEQARELDPLIRSWELRGTFALTEPDSGSDIARGIATRCRRDGGDWIIDGAKRWIGAADTADRIALFAREDDGAVRCFLVPRDAPGLTLRRIEGKTSLRIMQNFDIELVGVRVSDTWRLGGISSFADVAGCLRAMRSDVSWIATGVAAGAYEAALAYTTARRQFGQSIAGFQLVQEKLARMAAGVTASIALASTLTARQASGVVRDEDSALAKMFTAGQAREIAALAREVCGGNGITLAHDVARFHADAEAVYSYEGTAEINALIVGRAITGIGAFTRTPVRD